MTKILLLLMSGALLGSSSSSCFAGSVTFTFKVSKDGQPVEGAAVFYEGPVGSCTPFPRDVSMNCLGSTDEKGELTPDVFSCTGQAVGTRCSWSIVAVKGDCQGRKRVRVPCADGHNEECVSISITPKGSQVPAMSDLGWAVAFTGICVAAFIALRRRSDT